MSQLPFNPPPKLDINIPVVHKISELYKKIYSSSSKIPKKDRFGLYLKIENTALEIVDLCIIASLETKPNKFPHLAKARVKIESLKRLFRIAYELGILENKKYIDFESNLQEISKMINGWIKYLK